MRRRGHPTQRPRCCGKPASPSALAGCISNFWRSPLTIAVVFAIYVNVINIDMGRSEEEQAAMYAVVTRIDDFGRPAWITLMVLGFIVFWPIGLAILAYIIWSGRMGCSAKYGGVQEWRDR